MDAYITNWGGSLGGLSNILFRNDGNNTFTRITGQPLVTNKAASLSSVWGDYDNDGDLDVYVTNDNNSQDRLYLNDGERNFSNAKLPDGLNTHRGATAGDYDNDGDLDLYVAGPKSHLLLANKFDNENNWICMVLVGTSSNRSAIGAKVLATATINGTSVTQLREVSSQNTFNGQNSLRVHFGLGDASMIDEISIRWPAGSTETISDIEADQFMKIKEGSGIIEE